MKNPIKQLSPEAKRSIKIGLAFIGSIVGIVIFIGVVALTFYAITGRDA